MKLSIVIVNWNTRELLAQCLRSIQNTTSADVLAVTEILVVDNASTDDSVAMLTAQFSQVQLIENAENVGFARANNQAIRLSRGTYVLLLNPDTEVLQGALEALLTYMDGAPNIGAAGPCLLNPDRTFQVSCYPAPTLTHELWRLLHLDPLYPYGSYWMHTWSKDSATEVDTVQGACLIIRQEALAQTGLLDEDYFMYTEEIDLCYRLRKSGWRLSWVPYAQVVHYGGQSTRLVAAKMFLHLYSSKLLYFRKHHGPVAAQLYKAILFMTGLLRLLASPLAQLVAPAKRKQHQELANNYRQLLHTLPQM